MSTVETINQSITESLSSLSLRSKAPENNEADKPANVYRYANLLPVFPQDEHYPPLTPFDHVDPASRALNHPDPRAFLANATSIVQLTPHLGEEVRGVNLATLDNDGRDQLALEVRGPFHICSQRTRAHCVASYGNVCIGRQTRPSCLP